MHLYVSLLSDVSVLANAMQSVTDSGGSSATLTRQVDLLERQNAELEQKLLGKLLAFVLVVFYLICLGNKESPFKCQFAGYGT